MPNKLGNYVVPSPLYEPYSFNRFVGEGKGEGENKN